jgi:hypothetical protein
MLLTMPDIMITCKNLECCLHFTKGVRCNHEYAQIDPVNATRPQRNMAII